MTQQDSSAAHVRFHRRKGLGVVELNRPAALHALTRAMVGDITRQLHLWAGAEEIEAVVLCASGDRAFCAGGDIRALYDWGQSGAPAAEDFYREEYQLNYLLKTYAKPVLSLMQGVTMGGGAGIGLAARWRFVGPDFRFAMPETGIGLFPDAGGSYYLSRLRAQSGIWLALTGARLNAAEACSLGLGTHYLSASGLEAFRAALAAGEDWRALADFAEPPPTAKLEEARTARCFGASSMAEILSALKADGSAWAGAQVESITRASPLSCAVALRQLRAGAQLDFAACLRMELRLALRLMRQPDFYAGVRAAILDKTNKPRWAHASHADVSDKLVDAIFAELGDKELQLGKGAAAS